jgi:hypothetical protein
MTAQQALQILDNAAASYAGTRGDHVKIQTAIAVLRDLVDKAEPEAQGPKEKAAASTPENQTPASDGKESGGDKAKSKTE